jgi:hypothetical protein
MTLQLQKTATGSLLSVDTGGGLHSLQGSCCCPDECSYEASPDSLSFVYPGETQTGAIAVTADCDWTAVNRNSDAWLTFTPDNGSGDESIDVTAAANSGASRTGYIDFYEDDDVTIFQTVTCTQDAYVAPTIEYYLRAAQEKVLRTVGDPIVYPQSKYESDGSLRASPVSPAQQNISDYYGSLPGTASFPVDGFYAGDMLSDDAAEGQPLGTFIAGVISTGILGLLDRLPSYSNGDPDGQSAFPAYAWDTPSLNYPYNGATYSDYATILTQWGASMAMLTNFWGGWCTPTNKEQRIGDSFAAPQFHSNDWDAIKSDAISKYTTSGYTSPTGDSIGLYERSQKNSSWRFGMIESVRGTLDSDLSAYKGTGLCKMYLLVTKVSFDAYSQISPVAQDDKYHYFDDFTIGTTNSTDLIANEQPVFSLPSPSINGTITWGWRVDATGGFVVIYLSPWTYPF